MNPRARSGWLNALVQKRPDLRPTLRQTLPGDYFDSVAPTELIKDVQEDWLWTKQEQRTALEENVCGCCGGSASNGLNGLIICSVRAGNGGGVIMYLHHDLKTIPSTLSHVQIALQ